MSGTEAPAGAETPGSSKEQKRKRYTDRGPLVWVDCEMTGLDILNDTIIEICCIITDKDLEPLEKEPYHAVVHVPETRLEQMGHWCTTTHKRTGLWDKVVASRTTLKEAETGLLAYLKKHVRPNEGMLAGNSVHQDRIFMQREVPLVIEYLHYRIVDVSSIAEVGFRLNPDLIIKAPSKTYAHSAHNDILESIRELRWYMDHFLVGEGERKKKLSHKKAKQATKKNLAETPKE